MTTVAAIVPSVPPRAKVLARAIDSIAKQTCPVDQIAVSIDNKKVGPGLNRTLALEMVTTDFVASCDDDDEWRSDHIEVLLRGIEENGADVAFSHCQVIGGEDPFPQFFGMPWHDDEPRIFGCWFMARTELLKDIGGWRSRDQIGKEQWADQWSPEKDTGGEDFDITKRLIKAGAKIVHVPERSYIWYHHGNVFPHYSGTVWE